MLLVGLGGLPVGGVVALHAVWPEAALVLVLVAGSTSGRQAHISVVQILGVKQRL